MRLSTRLFWGSVLLGAALRVLVVSTIGGRLDSDQAIVYLMARHGGDGLLFWGQTYGGTLLQVTAAGAFGIFGASVPLLQLVEALWWLGAVVLLRALAVRLWGQFVGDLAGALVWLPGPVVLWLTVRDPGFYGPAVALGAGTLLLALDDRRLSPLRALGLGVTAGLAIWTLPLTLAFVVPAAALVLLRRREGIVLTLVGAAAGLVPLLVAKMHQSSSSAAIERTPLGDVPRRAAHVVFQLLPSAWVGDWTVARASIGFLWTGLVLGGVVLALGRRSWNHLALAAAGALTVVLLASSTAILEPVSLRYGALLAPVPFLLLAAGFGSLGRVRWLGWVLVLALAGWTLQVTHDVTRGFEAASGNHWEGEGGDLRRNGSDYARAGAVDVPRLVAYLSSQGIRAVYADYWVSYVIPAESGERVTADPLSQSRYRPYRVAAASAARTTVVVFAGGDNEKQIRSSTALPAYTATEVAGFVVFAFQSQAPLALLPHGTY